MGENIRLWDLDGEYVCVAEDENEEVFLKQV